MLDGIGLKLAAPRSRNEIRRDTYQLRLKLGMKYTEYFPIVHFVENVLPKIDTQFYLDVVDDNKLIGRHAETIPAEHVIRIKQSVYDAAVNGFWWARSILAHEVGHYNYHNEQTVRYAKLDPFEKVPPDFDPERQANIFAAELLVPIHLIHGLNKEQIGKKFGVSYEIAKRQISTGERIQKKQKYKKGKKKRLSKKPNR
ncbi:ImmA/IrrE family metallo-endopeptidase [Anaerotruncus sp.]|uniref:ImmA/IrrE family metallo-endopeptidase n=1 Tax=Anaerotruncus TaxID=244127 RepID=UPI00216F584C|nr:MULTISPECIES: ImmA/IrrE family metallo-endopeptidase [Anaerotruncus]MCI8494000.1 ImmA/IrrE family metallo-endopeptidase [Anaerotruncus sp.]